MKWLILIVIILSSLPVKPVLSDVSKSDSVPIDFEDFFIFAEREISIGDDSLQISLVLESKLKFRESMILTTSSSQKFVTNDRSTSISIRPTNVISLLKFTGETYGYIEYDFNLADYLNASFLGFLNQRIRGKMDIEVNDFEIHYSVAETMGYPNTVVMDEKIIYTGTIPGGIQITIFMKPVLEYVPKISGDLLINEPSSSSSVDLYWIDDRLNAEVMFSENHPIDLSLINPVFSLGDFRVGLDVYAIFIMAKLSTPRIEVLTLGDYHIESNEIQLLSLEPNYYGLYLELLRFNYAPVLQEKWIENNFTGIYNELNEIENNIMTVSGNNQEIVNDLIEYRQDIRTLGEDLQTLTSSTSDQINSISNDLNSIEQTISSTDNRIMGLTWVMIITVLLLAIILYFLARLYWEI